MHVVGINTNWGDQATMHGIRLINGSSTHVCAEYQGVAKAASRRTSPTSSTSSWSKRCRGGGASFDPAALTDNAGRVSGSHSGPAAGSRPNVRIVHLNGPAFHALAQGDLAAAEAVSPVALSPYLAGPQCRGLWRMRSEQSDLDPSSAAWVTGVVWDERRHLAVGAAGFHGPPDSSGMVEIGYRIDPAHRRRGYARAALEALLARAATEPDVHRVRVSIAPDNLPSSGLALQYGFRQVGEQWDDEDGLELVYEVPVGPH